jgi:hypothetical protein
MAALETDALLTSGDADDDRTVASSNGGTNNRTNSALVRQRRPDVPSRADALLRLLSLCWLAVR